MAYYPSAADALARFGNKPMPELRCKISKEFGCHRGHDDAPFNDECKITYGSSGEEMLGIAPRAPKPDHMRTLGELAQHEKLFAPCAECKVSVRRADFAERAN